MQSKSANWYEVTAKYLKMDNDGIEKRVSEIFVVDAVSFTEAEKRIIKEVSEFGKAVEVKKINPAPFREVFFDDLDSEAKWFKAKLAFIESDEETGKEKRSNVVYLVQAEDFDEALSNINKVMKGSMEDFLTANIAETKICAVFIH